jgi:hypothetical protein
LKTPHFPKHAAPRKPFRATIITGMDDSAKADDNEDVDTILDRD